MSHTRLGAITDHVAAAEKMVHELLLVCPDPQDPEFEDRQQEYQVNVAARAVLVEAMDQIAISMRKREMHSDTDDGTRNTVVQAITRGICVGEEAVARRTISRFVMAFNGL